MWLLVRCSVEFGGKESGKEAWNAQRPSYRTVIQVMERTGTELEDIQARMAPFLKLRVAALSDLVSSGLLKACTPGARANPPGMLQGRVCLPRGRVGWTR